MSGWIIAAACLVPNLGGWLNGLVLIAKSKEAHVPDDFLLPAWAPPAWITGPVWVFLYTSMGYASYLVWRDGGGFHGIAKYPLYVYIIQLIINWLYPPIYFGEQNIKWGFLDLFTLCIIAGLCGLMFYSINKLAGLLFIPYIAWLIFATVLNYYIWKNNEKIHPGL